MVFFESSHGPTKNEQRTLRPLMVFFESSHGPTKNEQRNRNIAQERSDSEIRLSAASCFYYFQNPECHKP